MDSYSSRDRLANWFIPSTYDHKLLYGTLQTFRYENHTSVYYNLCDVPLCKNVNPLYHF